MKKVKVDGILYFLLVFLSIFNDSPFSLVFGFFGRPVLCVVIPVVTIIYLIVYRKIILDDFSKRLIMLIVLLLVVNVIVDIAYYIKTGMIQIGTENIFIKSIKGIVYMVYNAIYYILIYNLGLKMDFEQRFRPFAFTFFFLFFVLIVELITMPHAWPIFHYENSYYSILGIGASNYNRVRLTATESSLTVPLIIVFGTLTLFYYKQKRNRIMFILSIIILSIFILTSSARTLLIFAAAFLIFVIFKYISKSGKNKRKLFLVALIILFIPILVFVGSNYIYEQIFTKSLGSLATRMTSFVAAVIHMVKYPFGMGNSVYSLTMYSELSDVVNWFMNSKIGSSWNYWEVTTQFLTNPESLGAFGILSYSLYWGLFGTIIMYFAFFKLHEKYKKSYEHNTYISAAYWGFLVVMTLTVPINNCFPFWGFLAMISLFAVNKGEMINVK